MVQNAPQLHHIWPQSAPGALRQHLFPLSTGVERGLGGEARNKCDTWTTPLA
ncbi:MAG TPA: hypothetical protein VKB35_12760 [Ktedonobacteraceae bacterium]|nr:hypothetical protein [Ktedonobacteraceae bacterium]